MSEAGVPQKPLEGVRVVEMGSLLAGPFCGQHRGELTLGGDYEHAFVVKVMLQR